METVAGCSPTGAGIADTALDCRHMTDPERRLVRPCPIGARASDIVSARSADARFEPPEADEAAHRHRVTGASLPSEVRWSA